MKMVKKVAEMILYHIFFYMRHTKFKSMGLVLNLILSCTEHHDTRKEPTIGYFCGSTLLIFAFFIKISIQKQYDYITFL